MLETSTPLAPLARPRPWWLHPYLHLGISILLSAAVQLPLKLGADDKGSASNVLGFAALLSPWTWLGVGGHIGSLLCWLYALRTAPLSIAYNLAGSIHILVALGAWAFLGEHISLQRWAGICLISIGVVITARQASQTEERL